MTDARYLIRIDDICEGLNIQNFKKLIDILKTHKIRPIIAVVPNNKDKNLNISQFNLRRNILEINSKTSK